MRIFKQTLTKEFISKTTFLSFPVRQYVGRMTGESRKTLDARLTTSGMTYKDIICAITNDSISNTDIKY